MHYLYILQSIKDGGYYVGVSKDVNKRLRQHNDGKSRSTVAKRPWRVVLVEAYKTPSEAYLRERFIKSKKSKKIIETIINKRPCS